MSLSMPLVRWFAYALYLSRPGFKYNATYLATYVESGVRRISLAEQIRKIRYPFW